MYVDLHKVSFNFLVTSVLFQKTYKKYLNKMQWFIMLNLAVIRVTVIRLVKVKDSIADWN